MDKELFGDLVASLKESIEFGKGNTQLKTTEVEIPGDDISFYNAYGKLSDTNKIKAMSYVNELLHAN